MNVLPAAIAGPNEYLSILEAAWHAHLAPRAADAPTVISLFAGCGGSSLGYSMAGYRELLAVEWDAHAAEIFRLNFPHVPLYAGDIASLSLAECLQQTGLQPGELDVLDGSPPCQGFSTAGKQSLDDPRNQLFHEYVRLLDGLQPRCFIMENVWGMVQGKLKLIFADIMRALKGCGYAVKAWRLNAQYYHVPQSRERLIFLGCRLDMPRLLTLPMPLCMPFTLRQALQDLPSSRIASIPYPAWLRQAVKEIKRRETTGNRSKARAFMKYKGTKGSAMSFVRLAWDRPATTICKTFISVAWLGHPDDERFINESEVKRLASFPDAFQFHGTFKDVVARIGNAVPPLFMRAIAQHVRMLLASKGA